MYKVKQISKMSGIPVTTLQFWDDKKYFSPSGKRDKGDVRLYTMEDLLKLQLIILFRELHVPIKEISEEINSETFDFNDLLNQQIDSLEQKILRMKKLVLYAKFLKEVGSFATLIFMNKKDSNLFDYFCNVIDEYGLVKEENKMEIRIPQNIEELLSKMNNLSQDDSSYLDKFSALFDELIEVVKEDFFPEIEIHNGGIKVMIQIILLGEGKLSKLINDKYENIYPYLMEFCNLDNVKMTAKIYIKLFEIADLSKFPVQSENVQERVRDFILWFQNITLEYIGPIPIETIETKDKVIEIFKDLFDMYLMGLEDVEENGQIKASNFEDVNFAIALFKPLAERNNMIDVKFIQKAIDYYFLHNKMPLIYKYDI
ncbi:MerR family transcriptional regulator [Brotaphodocola sp.]|uniref:MerR family transcriptional regulator n=1 Tax=Brotaphodocola sp. TaxID=3073577 RepID=UPI003D7EF5D6